MDNYNISRTRINLNDLISDINFQLRDAYKKIFILIEGAREDDIVILDKVFRERKIPYLFGLTVPYDKRGDYYPLDLNGIEIICDKV